MKKISLFVTAIFSCVLAYGQTFTNVISGSGLPASRTILWGFIDYNGDGYEDLLASTGNTNPFLLKLWKNNGNSTFSDVTANSGLASIDSIRFGRVADFNKDGKKDFLFVDYNNNLKIFCANNSAAFEDKTTQSGFSLIGNMSPDGFQIVDKNQDGYPDFCYYRKTSGDIFEIVCTLNGYSGNQPSTTALLPPFSSGITPQFQFSDYDSDRDLDLLVQTVQTYPWPGAGYYYHPFKTYRNQNGAFTEVANVIPISVSTSYLIETDYNQDGFFDFIGGTSDNVFNGTPIVPVLKNSGNGTFINSSSNPNFRIGNWYYSAFSEADFDLDGDLDYYSAVDQSGLDGSRFWVNTNGSFTEQSSSLGIRLSSANGGSPRSSWFDMDNDGDLDCFGTADPGNLLQASLAKNNQSSANKWIKVNLKGCQSGTDGFYAVVKAKVGGSSYYRRKSPFQGNLAQSQFLHFGLGTANTIDSLIVKWPSGRTTILTNVAANQTLTVNEDNCNSVSTNCPDLSGSLLQGLVGYWPFCGNANDESGNGNNGTVNGATLTADRFGNAGSAYSFDGSGTHIQTPLIQNQISKYSISTWFKTQTGGTLITGRKKVNVPSWIMTDTIGLTMDLINEPGGNPDIGKMRFMADGQFYQCGKLTPESLNSTLRNNNWHHIVGVWDGSTSPPLITPSSFSIYVDGILISCTDISLNSANAPINGYMGILFGKHSGWGNWSNFNGSLDDIAIWNRALTPQEITQLYNQGICQTSITVTDTLLIHTGITSYNPVAYGNTLKVWPNPGNTAITLDAGNLALMQGWKIRISNSLGQEVYPATLISQQQQVLSMSTWGGNGLYLLHLINPQGHITEVKKIVLAP